MVELAILLTGILLTRFSLQSGVNLCSLNWLNFAAYYYHLLLYWYAPSCGPRPVRKRHSITSTAPFWKHMVVIVKLRGPLLMNDLFMWTRDNVEKRHASISFLCYDSLFPPQCVKGNKMNVFFAGYSSDRFTYNPKIQPEIEFGRLQNVQGWDRDSQVYKRVRREFLEALVEETKGPVHAFFVVHYPDFDYDSRASPRLEFQRLREFRKWTTTSRPYKRAKRLFKEAFDDEFDSDLDEYFKGYPSFDYNPRNEPKAEFERLRKLKGWTKRRYGSSPRQQALKEEYRVAREGFYDAFVGVFSYFFGISGDLHNWAFLCDLLGVDPVPATVEDCKLRLEPFHINIYNLLDHVQEKVPIIYFPDLEALTVYSWGANPKGIELIYPIHLAQGNQLRFLLRRIGKKPQVQEEE